MTIYLNSEISSQELRGSPNSDVLAIKFYPPELLPIQLLVFQNLSLTTSVEQMEKLDGALCPWRKY